MWESLRQVDTPSPGPPTELREAIKKRNALRRTVADNRAEYLEVCAATRKLSEESRQKKWEEFLADLENNPTRPARGELSSRCLERLPQ